MTFRNHDYVEATFYEGVIRMIFIVIEISHK